MEKSLPFTDLVPHRRGRLLLFFVIAVFVVAALELLYWWSFRLTGLTTDGSVAMLDLDSEGTLAVWFSSVTLLASGGYAYIIYRLRRAQIGRAVEEMPGGRSDVACLPWLLAACCWTVMSIDETGSLHEGFKEAMTLATGTRLHGDGSLWWIIPYCLILTGIGSRLLVDMWPRMIPIVMFFLAAGFYILAVVAQLGLILPTADRVAIMIEEGAEMLGNLAILATMMLQSRIVHKELGGELTVERREPATVAPKTTTVHQRHETPKAPTGTTRTTTSNMSGGGSFVGGGKKKMSRADKKALRKRLMAQRDQRRGRK